MASFNVKDVERAKLQRELEYYTSLVSKHEKLQQTGKTVAAKDNKPKVFVKPFQLSLQTDNCSGSRISPAANSFKLRPVPSKVNAYKRMVIQNQFTNPIPSPLRSFPKRLVVAPTPTERKRNAPFATSINKVNNIQQRTVLYNTKKVVPNVTINVSNRSVLLPEITLKRTNGSISKPQISNSAKSSDLGKVLAETQKIFMKAGSKKQIEELKALTKQLELRNKKLSLAKKRISSMSSLKSRDVLVSPIVPSTNKSSFKKTNLNCQIKPELILKTDAENQAKNFPIHKSVSDKMPKISNVRTAHLSRNDKSTFTPLETINVETPVACSIIGHKSLGNESNLSFRQTSDVQGKDNLVQLVKNPKLFQSNNASVKKDTLSLPKTAFSGLSANVSLKTPINNSLMKAKCVLGNKLSISSKQISKMNKVSLTKLVNSQKPLTNSASTPATKRIVTPKQSNTKKRGNATKLIASKYKVINKRLSPAVSSNNKLSDASIIKAKNLLGASKETSTKLKIQKNVQSSCASTPLAITMKGQKVNSIKRQGNMTKLIASKYKVVNKKIPISPAVSSRNRFSKNRPGAPPNLFNKWHPHAASKTPSCTKRLPSNCTVMNHVKTPKRLNNSLLKSPSPKFLKKGKYVLKRRKLDTSISIDARRLKNVQNLVLIKPQFKHTKVNYLIGSNSKKSKPNLRMKSSSCSPLKSKYKVINRRGSSKKSLQNPKPSPVLRTKSGVDIDLLIELAAEKESTENESRVVHSKRVYKSKNTIVNTNVCSVNRAKMVRMIKAKYLLNKNVSQKQTISRKLFGTKYYKGYRYLQRTPTSQFCNLKIKRDYFKFPAQSHKHKLTRNYKALPQYVKTNKRIFTYGNEHLRTHQNRAYSTPISKVLANRVLHQSINRVITASAKKKLSKVNTYCMFYNRFGRCNKGLKCTYVHDPSKIAVCTRFLRGTCKNDNCLFSHEISPGKMAICSFFLLGSCMKTDCPYRHETLSPNAELCKAFVQGYCPDGKQCKKAHVLVCPHFIQGFCEKGDTCAFPHPPPKEKKMLPKTIEKRETLMEVDDLMERVSRYFQPSNEQSIVLETNKTTVIPKRQKLPEQPSFIAL